MELPEPPFLERMIHRDELVVLTGTESRHLVVNA